MIRAKAALIWAVVVAAIAVPVAVAASSPLLEWRQPIYIVAGLAGVIGLALIFVQPLLAGNRLPAVGLRPGRRIHRLLGALLVLAVVVHVAGLWITSPPDVVDALLFASPTRFSAWGVIAMWAVFAAALLAVFRHRIGPRLWRLGHSALVVVVVGTTVVHALLIDGTMGQTSKALLCAMTLGATAWGLGRLRVWRLLTRRGA